MITIFYTPTIISPEPSTAINGSTTNNFTWQSNETSPDTRVAYQVFIYRNDTNALVYDSTKITSTLQYHTVPALILTNTNSYQYKWKVRLWKDGSNYVDSNWSLFSANSSPSISFSVPATVTSQNYEFSATYSQAEGTKLKEYKFLLYDNAATPNLVSDSGWIYSTSATPTYEFTGMVSGDTYNIEVQTISQLENTADSALYSFNVSYTYPDTVPEFYVENRDDIGALYLNWTNLKQVIGTISPSATPTYTTGKFGYGLELPNGSELTYSEEIPEDFTVTFWSKFPEGSSGDVEENPTSAADDNSIGDIAWSNPTNIYSSNNSHSSCELGQVDFYSETNADNQYITQSFFYGYGIGQAFAVDTDCILSKCKFYLKKVGSPTGYLEAYLYAHTGTYGDGTPGTYLATSNQVNESSLSTNFELVTFNFTGLNAYALQAGYKYYIVIYTQHSTAGVSDYTVIGADWSSPTHGGNACILSTSFYWTKESNRDLVFYVYGDRTSYSHYLKASDFSFSLPSTATIQGIKVDIEKKEDSSLTEVFDYEVKIIKSDGSLGSENKSEETEWATSDTYSIYGSDTDLWSEEWTASDINNTNFGVAISCQGYGTAYIDHIKITVYYIDGFTGEIVALDDTYKVGYNGTKFYWQFDDRIIVGKSINSYISDTMYPSDELYPADNLLDIGSHGWFLFGLKNDTVVIKSPYFEDILQ